MFNTKYRIFFIALVVILLDQITKYWVEKNVLYAEAISIFDNILSLTKSYNAGAAFGMFQSSTLYLATFSAIVAVFILVYIIKFYKSNNLYSLFGWGLLLGGTIGNLLDRVRFNYVVDFIKLDFINFPIFNIADSCINIGAGLLVIYLLFFSEKESEQKNE